MDERVHPYGGPAAWRSTELDLSWQHQLTGVELDDLQRAVSSASNRGLSFADLRPDGFPLPVLAPRLSEWADVLDGGRGFVLVRGLPVERWTLEEASIAYYGLGLHLGVPVAQNSDGDLLGHVRDTGDDPNDPTVRRYRTREPQPMHTDGSDLVGLLCLKTAKVGGLSSIVSSTAVFDETLRRRPDLAPLWFEHWSFDLYGQQAPGAPPFWDAPMARVHGNRLSVMYLRWYVEKAQGHAGAIPLTSERAAFLDLVDEIANDPSFRLDMDFAPGDVQLLSNHTILHARTGYEDWDDPARKRHLLRLWLTLHRNAPDGAGRGGVDKIGMVKQS